MSRFTARAAGRLGVVLGTAIAAAVVGCSEPSTRVASAPRGTSRDASPTSTIVVTNTDDAGAGSLRDAIANAPDGSLITFDPSIAGQTITLTSGELLVDGKSLTIEGPVPGGITISGGDEHRVFHAMSTSAVDIAVTLRNLTITQGNAAKQTDVTDAGEGGGIEGDDEHETIIVDHALITNTVGNNGGGIGASVLQITNSTVAGNTGGKFGGGIFAFHATDGQ